MPDHDIVYIDTSVLIKWYVTEAFSDKVEQFFDENSQLAISELVMLEFGCTMRRLERNNIIDAEYRANAEISLNQLTASKWFQLAPISNQAFQQAKLLIETIAPLALRTLNAMHLSIAKKANIKRLATSDKQMLTAAQQLNFYTEYFNN